MEDKFKKLFEDDNSEAIGDAAEVAKEKVWSRLDLHDTTDPTGNKKWKWLTGLLFLLLAFTTLFSILRPEPLKMTDRSVNDDIQKLKIEHQAQLDKLLATRDSIQAQYNLLESQNRKIVETSQSPKTQQRIPIEYKEVIQTIHDTIYLKPESNIVYVDKFVRDTIFLEKIIEIPISDKPMASIEEPVNKRKTKSSVKFDLRNHDTSLEKKAPKIFSIKTTLN